MARLVFITLCALSLSLFALPSHAAKKRDEEMYKELFKEEAKDFRMPADFSYKYNPVFDFKVRQAYVGRSENFNFYELRQLYTSTSQYDPTSEKTLNTLHEQAYRAQSTSEEKEKNAAFSAFKDLVLKHLANIDVILLAIYYARQDPRYGEVDFYEWVRDGLVYSIGRYEKGETIRLACNIMVLGEEALLFSTNDLKILDTEFISGSRGFYHLHLVEDTKTGKKREYYTNISAPMEKIKIEYLKRLQEQERKKIDILPQ